MSTTGIPSLMLGLRLYSLVCGPNQHQADLGSHWAVDRCYIILQQSHWLLLADKII